MRGILYLFAIAGTAAGALLSAPAEIVRVEPGLWTFEARVGRVSASGLPPGVSQARLSEAMFGEALRAAGPVCITPRAARFDDLESFRVGGYRPEQCRKTLSATSGGPIRIAGSCSDARGNRRDFTITGMIGLRDIDLLVHYDDRASGQPGHIEGDLRFTGHRTGPCSRPSDPGFTGGGTGVEASNMAATDAAAAH